MNGKGDNRRGQDQASRKRYAAGWDRVFKKPTTRKMPAPAYPSWVCLRCGCVFGCRDCSAGATWHRGRCDICGAYAGVTQPRDFGHLPKLPR